jgi:mannose-1-phosphate guanylyltransferase
VKNAQKYLDGQDFLVVGGDHVTDVNVLDLYRSHQRHRALATICLIPIDDPSEYGIAEIDADYDIIRFWEKPSPGEIFSNLASTGMYVCSPEIFDHIPSTGRFDFARDLFPGLMKTGCRIKGYLARGNWSDVGTPKSLRQAECWKLQSMRFSDITGNLSMLGAQVQGPAHLGDSIALGKNSRVIGPVSIGPGTSIGENVLIGPYTSIGDTCIIRNNARIFSSSLYNRIIVGADTTISGSIIDNDTRIGERCCIENNTVIGPRAVLRDNVVVHAETHLWPEVVVPDGAVVKEHVLNEKFDTRFEGK